MEDPDSQDEADRSPPSLIRRLAWLWVLAGHGLMGLFILRPGYIEPDSVGATAWLRSIVFDLDFLFFNEWSTFGMIVDGLTTFKEVTSVGALANHWGLGVAELTSLVYVPVVALIGWRPNGFGMPYGFVFAIVNVLAGAATILVTGSLMSKLGVSSGRRISSLTAISIGTPFFFYQYFFPIGTHIIGALFVAGLVWFLLDHDLNPDLRAAGTGLFWSLAVLTRIQHAIFFPIVAWALLSETRKGRSILVAFIFSAPAFLAQAVAWWGVYGSPFGPVTGGANLGALTWAPFANIAVIEVLFSSYHGLLSWSPVIALSLIGFLRLDSERRRVSIVLLAMFALQLLANSTLDRYFWGGMGFGARRFVDLFAVFAVGLGFFLEKGGKILRWALVAFAVLFSVLLTLAAHKGELELASDVRPRELVEAALSVRDASSVIARAPFRHAEAIPWYLGVLLISVVVSSAIWWLAQKPRAFLIAGLIWSTTWMCAAVVASARTKQVARAHQLFNVDVETSRSWGPLQDQKNLLALEVQHYQRRGDTEKAERTIDEIVRIDEHLQALSERRAADKRAP